MVPLWSMGCIPLCSTMLKSVVESLSPCLTPEVVSNGSLSFWFMFTLALELVTVIIARLMSLDDTPRSSSTSSSLDVLNCQRLA